MLWELRRPWPVAEFRSLCIVAGSRLRQVQGGAGWQGRQLAVHELVACVRRIATFARIARRQLASAQPQLEHKLPQAFRHVGPIMISIGIPLRHLLIARGGGLPRPFNPASLIILLLLEPKGEG